MKFNLEYYLCRKHKKEFNKEFGIRNKYWSSGAPTPDHPVRRKPVQVLGTKIDVPNGPPIKLVYEVPYTCSVSGCREEAIALDVCTVPVSERTIWI